MTEENEAVSFPTEGMTHGRFTIEKYNARDDGEPDLENGPFEVVEGENTYVNSGGVALLNLVAGLGGNAFDAAHAYIGVGENTGATTAGMTDLQGSSKVRVGMDGTFPSIASQVMTWQATFASGVANQVWGEMGLFNAASSGTMLCRSNTGWGTKVTGTAWIATYTIQVP